MEEQGLTKYQKISKNRSFVMTETESTKAYSEPLHWHTSIEFFYVYQGIVEFQLDAETYTLGKGDVVFIDSARNHGLTYEASARALSLKISAVWLHSIVPEFFTEDMALCTPAVTAIEEREEAERFCKTLLLLKDVFYSDEKYGDIGINGYIFGLLYQLMSSFQGKSAVASKYQYDSRLKQTIRYLHMHYKEEVSLQDIADMLFVSPQYISRLFRNYYSMTYKQYLTKIRLEHAVYEMLYTDANFLEIAMECGFSSQHSFIDAFKKRYGMTPSQYKYQYYDMKAEP